MADSFDGLGRKRNTHCKHGHLFPADAKLKVNWKGYSCRVCKECDRIRMQQYRTHPEFLVREAEKAKRYRLAHPEKYRASWEREHNKKRQILLDARVGGCIVCGEKDPACLDFHHRDGGATKEGHIGEIRRFSTKRLLAEIAKCDVLCANCHRKHHRDERLKISEGD